MTPEGTPALLENSTIHHNDDAWKYYILFTLFKKAENL